LFLGLEIVADRSGRIDDLKIKAGEAIASGDSIASFNRSEITREIIQVEADLENTKDRLKTVQAYYDDQALNESKDDETQLFGLAESKALLLGREKLLVERLDGIIKLVKRKTALKSQQIAIELELAQAKEKFNTIESQVGQIRTAARKRQSDRDLILLDENLKVSKLERKLLQLREQLQDSSTITTPHSGQVIALKVNEGDFIQEGTPIATLARDNTQNAEEYAVLYVSSDEGKRIKEGLEVEIVPTNLQKAQFGFIRGKVSFVSRIPTTLQEMQSVLRNEQLATQLAEGGSPFEVRIQFERDDETASGLKWSSSKGPDGFINIGTLLDASIIVERKPIADIVVPGLSKKLGKLTDG